MGNIEARRFRPEQQPPEKLSDQALGNLLSAIGNSEAKAALFLGMQPGEVYTAWDLRNLFLDLQGRSIEWNISVGTPIKYCTGSFEPIGLVAEEVSLDGQSIGYTKTDYGIAIATPLAGLLLDFSLNYPDISLGQIFGSTVSSSAETEIEWPGSFGCSDGCFFAFIIITRYDHSHTRLQAHQSHIF